MTILAVHNVGVYINTCEALSMIHMVGYLTVNTLFTVLHSIEKSIAFYE